MRYYYINCLIINKDCFISNEHFTGVAGMCSKTTVAPLDRIKILLQAHNKHYKHLGKECNFVKKKIYKNNTIEALTSFTT